MKNSSIYFETVKEFSVLDRQGNNQQVRIQVGKWNGKGERKLDIRKYYKKDDEWLPGKGIALNWDGFMILKKNMDEIMDLMEEEERMDVKEAVFSFKDESDIVSLSGEDKPKNTDK